MRHLVLCMALATGCVGMTSTPTPPVDGAKPELLDLVEELRQAELALQVVDDFLPCGDEASAKSSFSVVPRAWDGPDCFVRIGWAPKSDVRGGYWVEVTEDKSDFTVHGVADADGDGTFQEVVATKDKAAAAITPDTVF